MLLSTSYSFTSSEFLSFSLGFQLPLGQLAGLALQHSTETLFVHDSRNSGKHSIPSSLHSFPKAKHGREGLFGQPGFCVPSLLTCSQWGLQWQGDTVCQPVAQGPYEIHSSSSTCKCLLQTWSIISGSGGDHEKGRRNSIAKIEAGLTLTN